MRFILLVACALAIVCTVTAQSSADHYGGVSNTYEQKMKHYIHAWFDPLGVELHRPGLGNRMVGVACHESGFNPIAVNYAGPVAGLLQIRYPVWSANNPAVGLQIQHFWYHHRTTFDQFYERLRDPVQSVRLGFLIYKYHGDQWGGEC